jgi:spoIIIJ-associated protein
MSEIKYSIATVGAKVDRFLAGVLSQAGLDVTFELVDGEQARNYFEHPSLVVRFSGPDIECLTFNKGEALLALEQLTQEVLGMHAGEHALLCFDANDFRLLRQEELRLSALTIAERVRKSRVPYRFNPMTSRERRLLHLALSGEKDLRTESSGAGPGRHVVVYPADAPTLPELPAQPPFAPRGGRPARPRR